MVQEQTVNQPRRFWQKIVTIYCLTIFLAAAWLVAIPLSWLFRSMPGSPDLWRWRYHIVLHRFFRFAAHHIPGVSIRLHGAVDENFTRPAVIIANHQSHLDLLCLLMLSPRVVALTNDWVWHSAVYGPVIRYAEYYPVSAGLDTDGIDRLADLVRRGYSIIVFPEGTRSADCMVMRFHKGAFHLADTLGVDLLPVVLDSPGHILPKHDLTLSPGTIRISIGERVPPGDQRFGVTLGEKAKAWRQYFAQSITKS